MSYKPSQKRGAFIGAVGLLHSQGSRQGLPINFAQPKQPRPPRDPNRKKIIYAAAAAISASRLASISACQFIR